jgi:metacaspase-1
MLRALLVGINAYPASPLRGCLNDCLQMQQLLKQYYGFTDDSFKILFDLDATTLNIQAGLEWLASGGDDPAAVRVFHYSGHGSYMADQNGDEPDGRDECLVPYDYKTVGFLTDDTLKTFYDRFPATGNLTLIMDSCHSGSVNKGLDDDVTFRFLPVSYDEQKRIDEARTRFEKDQRAYVKKELRKLRTAKLTDAEIDLRIDRLYNRFEKKRFGDIRTREANILLAGCRPDQQSADARISGEFHGAFTYYLAKAVTDANGQLTYRQMVDRCGKALAANHYEQIPQLEYRSKRDKLPAFRPFA